MKQVLLYHEALTLETILHKLETEADDFLALVDQEQHLLGVISQGDIRRGVLNQKTRLADLMNRNPLTIQPGEEAQKALQGSANLYPYLPVVDEAHHLLSILRLDQALRPAYANPVVIMAGGLGKRLGELTQELPKPMLPMGYKPVLHLILDSFVEHGFREFYLCVNYKAEVIREYFGDGSAFGVRIHYIEESQPLGTAGALSLLPDSFDLPFFVMNGDLITSLNLTGLLHFHQEKEATATMCLTEYNQQLPYGVVHTRNSRILSLEEKPYQKYFVNAGIYLLNPAVLDYLTTGQALDMTTLFDRMLQADEAVHAYTLNEFWMDIGQAEDYEAAQQVFKQIRS